jgi:hypothetical protein
MVEIGGRPRLSEEEIRRQAQRRTRWAREEKRRQEAANQPSATVVAPAQESVESTTSPGMSESGFLRRKRATENVFGKENETLIIEEKNSYTTLFGESIDLNKISSHQRVLIDRLMSLGECESPGELRAGALISDARREIRRQFPVQRDYQQAMNGSIGAVYRDCAYRLLAKESVSTPEEEGRFVENIRHNPARILLDSYLNGWNTQIEFAQGAKLDPGTVSNLFKFVLETGSKEPRLSLARFKATCEELGVVPLAHHITQEAEAGEVKPPLDSKPSGMTHRERAIRVLSATVTTKLCDAKSNDNLSSDFNDELRSFVAPQLAALYGIEDRIALDHETDNFISDIYKSISGTLQLKVQT